MSAGIAVKIVTGDMHSATAAGTSSRTGSAIAATAARRYGSSASSIREAFVGT